MNTNTTSTLDYLNQQLIQAIELAKVAGTNTAGFVREQVPDVLHQLIVFKIVQHSLVSLAWLAVVVLLSILVRKLYKFDADGRSTKTHEEGLGYGIGAVFSLVIIALMGMVILPELINLAKAVVAPKIYLLEYARDLIKK
jgi:hypothetical protein